MIIGTQPPKIKINNNMYNLPTPKKNGREREEQVEIKDEFTNPNMKTVRFIKGYKFNGKYDFGRIDNFTDSNILPTLKHELNKSKGECEFYPYSDQDYCSFKCYAEITGYPVKGNINLKGMKLKVKQVGLDNKKMINKDYLYVGISGPLKVAGNNI